MRKFLLAVFVCALLTGSIGVPDVQACGGWWDPCCKWWEPSTCPEPVKQRVKSAAGDAVRYLGEQEAALKVITFGTCSSMLFGATVVAMGPACATSGAGEMIASITGFVADQIQRDPYTPEWPNDYQGRSWPELSEIGVESWTGDGRVDDLIFTAQYTLWLGDFIYESGNRVNSCYHDMGLNGPLDVCLRQLNRVNWGLYELGRYSQDAANNLSSLNQDTVGDLNVIIDALARTLVWFGSEVAQ